MPKDKTFEKVLVSLKELGPIEATRGSREWPLLEHYQRENKMVVTDILWFDKLSETVKVIS